MAATATAILPEDTIQSRALTAAADKLGESVERLGQIVRVYSECLFREHQRAKRDATRKIITEARAEAAAKGNAPTPERLNKGDLVDGEILQAGADAQVRLQAKKGQSATIGVKIAQDVIDRMAARKQITARQANAATMFRTDYQIGIIGARDPDLRDPFMVSSHTSGSRSFGEVQLDAGKRYARAIEKLGESGNVVESVVLHNKTIEDLVPEGGRRGEKKDKPDTYKARKRRLEVMHQLRDGLDRLGDAYGLPSEIIEEKILEGDQVVATIRYRHEADGRVSAITFDRYVWLVSCQDIGELRRKARERMAEGD